MNHNHNWQKQTHQKKTTRVSRNNNAAVLQLTAGEAEKENPRTRSPDCWSWRHKHEHFAERFRYLSIPTYAIGSNTES